MEKIGSYKLLVIDECDSTQDELKKIISVNEEKVAVLSFRQNRGRGSYGREWISDEGGLYLSLNIFSFPSKLPVSIIFSVLIIQALINYFDKFEDLKDKGLEKFLGLIYPNDIVIREKLDIDNSEYQENFYKLGGILVESYKNDYVVGIGLNVNNRISQYSLEHKAISLMEFYDRFFNIQRKFDILQISKEIIYKIDRFFEKDNKDINFVNLMESLYLFDFTSKIKNVDVLFFDDGKEIVDRFDQLKVDYNSRKLIFYKGRMRKEIDFERVRRIYY